MNTHRPSIVHGLWRDPGRWKWILKYQGNIPRQGTAKLIELAQAQKGKEEKMTMEFSNPSIQSRSDE
jgi:hypothetical protein